MSTKTPRFNLIRIVTGIALVLSAPNFSKAEDGVSLDDLMTPDEIAAEAGIPSPSILERGSELFSSGTLNKALLPMEGLTIAEWVQKQNLIDKDRAKVVLIVNKATKGTTAQKLIAYVDGVEFGRFDISTGREKYETAKSGRSYWTTTPIGYFRPTEVKPVHYSNTWKTNLKWTVFFRGGVAIHATTPDHYSELGSRASGGCVRMREDQAHEIFNLVKSAGKKTVPLIGRNGEVSLDSKGKEMSAANYDTLVIVRNLED